MFKQSIILAHEIPPTPSRSTRAQIVSVIAVIVFLAPLAWAGATICYSQWCQVMGGSTEVPTPVIDSIAAGLRDSRDWLADSIGPAIQDPYVALPVASLLLILGMAMLRR
jgi:hypothetical protein